MIKELTIGDDFRAHAKITNHLPESQGRIITAMSMCSNLIQVYSPYTHKCIWDMTGLQGIIPNISSVKALIRKNIIVPTITDKEWEVQIALGTADERKWEINKALFKPLVNAVRVIRVVEETLKERGVFDGGL